MGKTGTVGIVSLSVILVTVPGFGQGPDTSCFDPNDVIEYADYRLALESNSGAQGDVVGVTLTLETRFEIPKTVGLRLAVCHDPALLELVGEPYFNEAFQAQIRGLDYVYPVDESSDPENHRGHGFLFGAIGLNAKGLQALTSQEVPFPIATVYYRLRGSPGEVASISFCDNLLGLANDRCIVNEFTEPRLGGPVRILSLENKGGSLTVEHGPTTRPERPPPPPKAKVYPHPPTVEEAGFVVRLTTAIAEPGDRRVPVDVFVTTNVEYTGLVIPIAFDEAFLGLASVENRLLFGSTIFLDRDHQIVEDKDQATKVIPHTPFSVNNRRRAEEGEEVHAATLYFDVREGAPEGLAGVEVVSVVPQEDIVNYEPLVFVRAYTQTPAGDEIDSLFPTPPAHLKPGAAEIVASFSTFLGDATFDHRLDISDPLSLLGYIHLGQEAPRCLPAGDVDQDQELTTTDAINMLTAQFLGHPDAALLISQEVSCR